VNILLGPLGGRIEIHESPCRFKTSEIRGPFEIINRRGIVDFRWLAISMANAEVVACSCISLCSGLFEPVQSGIAVSFDTDAFVKPNPHLVLGFWKSKFGGSSVSLE